MVDSGTRNTRFLCSKAEKRRIRFQITHICKANGESHIAAEPQNRIHLLLRCRFHDQLCQRTERDFASMVLAVKLWNHGKTLLNRMGRSKAAAFKSYTGQVCIYFHDGLQRR